MSRFVQGLINKHISCIYIDCLRIFVILLLNIEILSQIKKNFFSPKYIFHTYSLPCYLYYYNLFNINRVKRIPLNNGELLTPEGLAYWSMDDGSKQSSDFFFFFFLVLNKMLGETFL